MPNALTDTLLRNNPITIHVLGVCSALAVTSSVAPALVMCGAVMFVIIISSVLISALRHVVPTNVRLIVEVMIVATIVICIDQYLAAYHPAMSRVLSVFVSLIVTNCIILARAESYARYNGLRDSALDALGNALGYSIVLLMVATVREIFGAGSWLGFSLLTTVEDGGWYVPNQLFTKAPIAFFLIAAIVALNKQLQGPDPSSQRNSSGP